MSKSKKNNQQEPTRSERIVDILLNSKSVPREDREEILRWLADGEKRAEKGEAFVSQFVELLKFDENPADAPRLWPQLAARLGIETTSESKEKTKPKGRRIHLGRIVRVAAVVIPFLVAATAVGFLVNKVGVSTREPVVATTTVSVPATPEQQTVLEDTAVIILAANIEHRLPDSTWVRLEQGSEIRHAETFEGGRKVELTGGAHFNVTKAGSDSDHFTVSTGYMDIGVLGTDFDVRSPAGEGFSTIDLYHGSVEVSAGGRTVLMKPAEHLHYDHQRQQMTLSGIPYGQLRYDEMPGLVFEHSTLHGVLNKLESDYGVKIEVVGVLDANDFEVRGDFTKFRTLDAFMERLKVMVGNFDYKISANEIIITINDIQ